MKNKQHKKTNSIKRQTTRKTRGEKKPYTTRSKQEKESPWHLTNCRSAGDDAEDVVGFVGALPVPHDDLLHMGRWWDGIGFPPIYTPCVSSTERRSHNLFLLITKALAAPKMMPVMSTDAVQSRETNLRSDFMVYGLCSTVCL
ncbi:hypothetical protein BaRGS_00037055 [Batillaria attramentaria]|uniref:Uncharacterized protein n=1 Tax=Batillaria attramentaria TaxID=370345 RepID=A0ABD0JA61_9CAEN